MRVSTVNVGKGLLQGLMLALAASLSSQAATLIATNSLWSYHKGTNEASTPVEAWRALAFDDSAWPVSRAPFYYDTDTSGNYTGNTLLDDMNNNYTCLFLRQAFVVAEAAAISDLALTFKCDDGFVMWLNTNEVRRVNVSSGPLVFTNTTPAGISKAVWTNLALPGAQIFLCDGTNQVAVQVFNRAKSNRDCFIDLELSARVHETIPPTLVAFAPPSGTVTQLTQISVTFSEPVTGLAAEDLLINEQPATAVTGPGASYTFSFPQPAYGPVTVAWDAEHGITDLASNRFAGPLVLATYTLVDQEPPQVARLNPPAGATVRQLSQIEITFTEPVAGVEAEDLMVNSQPAARVAGSGAGPYVFQFAAPATGAVAFAWAPNHGIVDCAQPPNPFAGGNWTLTYDPQAIIPSVVINEFLTLSLNSTRLKDEDGELQGWIELYNGGASAVALGGWALTDTAGAPDRWVFPDVTLKSGAYLVVFASGKDRRPVTGALHTNFKLNPAGEYLALFNNESPRRAVSEFAPEFPEQRPDYSYGRDPAEAWRYYANPSPGASNGVSRIAGVVEPVHFSVERGLYAAPFQLRLSTATSNAVIRFTTNGTAPTETTGQVYAQPLKVEHTLTLRAAAYQTDTLPSAVRTHTYVFPADVPRQPMGPAGFPMTTLWCQYGYTSDYGMDPVIVDDPDYSPMMVPALLALPALSIVMKTDDMFGAANGLYTHAGNSALEAACSVELINPDGAPGFQIDAGIQMHGGGSRMRTMKHAFRLRFKSEYGPAKLHFPFFPDSPVTEFDTIDLRADYNNHWTHGFDARQRSHGQLIRDAWFMDVQAAMGAVSTHSRYVHLYINGLYWGVYNPCERPDAAFAAAYFGGKKEDYDAINGTSPSPPVDGDAVARNAMLGLSNLGDPARYAQMQQYLNVTQYIDYMILLWYGANQDWGTTKNWYAFRRRLPGAGFIYVCWDNERTLEGVNDNQLSISPDGLQAKLAANADYRLAFADRAHKHFFNDGALTTNALIAAWMRRAAMLDTAIVAESARWGDSIPKAALSPLPYPSYNLSTPYNRNEDWLGEQGRLLTNYFPLRSAVALSQLRGAGLYPSVAAPVFSKHGGRVAAGFRLTMTNPGGAGTVYCTTNGVDPRVPVTSAISPEARAYSDASPLRLDVSQVVKARVRNASGAWSALNEAQFYVAEPGLPVRITELMYNPVGGSAYEFIELQNVGQRPADLSNASFTGVEFVFPPGTVLAPGAIVLLIPGLNPGAFQARYPDARVFGFYNKSLANDGERIALVDQWGQTITSVEYKTSEPWPASADGRGWSLELLAPDGAANDPANWGASADYGGSPGRSNPAPAAPAVRLNEVMAYNLTAVSNAWGFSDWVEIQNVSVQSVELAGWRLRGGKSEKNYVFPEGASLAAGDFLVAWCDSQTNSPGLHTGFALDRQGETLSLYDAASNRVDAISWGPQVADYSIGRVGPGAGAWQLNLPTPGATNQSAALAATANLAINEWMANPNPGADDWLELYNRSGAAPVSLADVCLGTSNALFQVKSLAFVPPLGCARLWADEQPGGNHLDFKLPASGGRIALYDAAGQLLDQIIYEPQREGVSQGRLPDGAATVASFAGCASPGAANYLPAYAGPTLNEVMAWNLGAVKDSQGRACDWVELYNPADAPFELAGMSLSEGASTPGQWTFPPGTTVAAKGFLVVWFDGSRPASTGIEANLNAGRGLAREWGGVYLFSASGQCVDRVEYGFQIANASIGRAGGQWRLLEGPTPGEANPAPAALGAVDRLKINEWMTSQANADEWFEVFNADARPVQLSGLYLTDDPSIAGQTRFQVAPLSFIAGHGWVKWVADGQPGQGLDHVNFSLDGRGETLRIYQADGTLIDSVDYDVQTASISEGRLPDGTATIARFPNMPTPEAANAVSLPPVIRSGPQDQRLLPGADARLEVVAYGTLPLCYQWERNGSALPGATNAALELYAVQATQAGQYRVVITNQVGSVTSAAVWLRIECPLTMLPPTYGTDGVFRLQLAGTAGSRYFIQVSTNLIDWLSLGAIDAPGGLADYADPEAATLPRRFYRALEKPLD